MTTPGPDDTVPPDPVPTPEEAAAQAGAQAAAEAAAAMNDQIRALAAEIAKKTLLDFDPATVRKGTVASIQATAEPPTLTVTISGDTLEIPGIRYLDSYAPETGDVVLIIKQGTDLFALGQIASVFSESEWVTVTLQGGFSHNGNLNGNMQVRRVWDHGAWRVDIQGGVNVPGGGVTVTNLPANYRPVSAQRRTVIAARDANGSNVVKVDIENSGNVNLVGGTTGSHSHAVNISDNEHTHQIQESSHVHPQHDHSIGITDNAHSHGIPNTEHAHTGTTTVVSGHEHVIPSTAHTHGGTESTAVTINGTTGDSNAGESVHTHGTNGALGTAVSINGNTDTESVEAPVWVSFNSSSSYWL